MSVASLVTMTTTVVAQERQGCFMVDPIAQFVDLDDICPTPPLFSVSAPSSDGLGTGDIQVTLRWATVDDLDLFVTGPDGVSVNWENPGPSPSGGQLDRDDNAGCVTMTQSPIENVFWPQGSAPEGQYSINVELFTRCDLNSEAPIDFEIRLLLQGEIETITGTVDDDNFTFTHTFALPLASP